MVLDRLRIMLLVAQIHREVQIAREKLVVEYIVDPHCEIVALTFFVHVVVELLAREALDAVREIGGIIDAVPSDYPEHLIISYFAERCALESLEIDSHILHPFLRGTPLTMPI